MEYEKFIEAKGIAAKQIKFVARAISQDVTRYSLNYMFVEPSDNPKAGENPLRLIGSNRCRVHIADIAGVRAPGLEPGQWRVLNREKEPVWLAKIKDKDAPVPPDFKRVMPEKTVYVTDFDTSRISEITDLKRFYLYFKLAKELVSYGFPNYGYLDDLLGYDWVARAKSRGSTDSTGNGVVLFESGTLKALMTLRDEEG
jgi:hypothetical protein